jgi:hypothetical protein
VTPYSLYGFDRLVDLEHLCNGLAAFGTKIVVSQAEVGGHNTMRNDQNLSSTE